MWFAAVALAVVIVLLVLAHERRMAKARADQLVRAAGALLAFVGPRVGMETGMGMTPDEVAVELDELRAVWEREWRRADEERRQLRSVLSGLRDGVVLLDRSGDVLLVNDAARDIWPRFGERLVGMNQILLFHDAELDAALDRAKSQGTPEVVEHLIPGPPRRHFEVRILPLRRGGPDRETGGGPDPETGAATGLLLVVRDTTDRHALDEMRRDFVANVSHELQTPLTSIQGFAETLRETPDLPGEQQHRFLSLILNEARRMTALVRDLLELARLESGAWRGEPGSVAAPETVAEVLEAARPAAAQKGVELRAGPIEPVPVLAYRDELRRALDNLVANAIAYTPSGGAVEISAGRSGPDVYLRVADTGIGIPPEHLSRIFERFYRVDKGRSRAAGGTGLGLSIVRHVVESNGGRVAVESQVGHGSRFTLYFPAPSVPAGNRQGAG